MRAFAAVLSAAFAVALVASPASAQEKKMEKKKMEHAEQYEHAHKEMGKHTMTGTMTPPESETRPVKYEMGWEDDGPHGTIVGTQESGEELRIEMQDLRMEEGKLMYSFSPPDEETLVVSCVLERQENGGFSGDCTDNEDGGTGHMTIDPMKEHMEEMNPCAAGMGEEHMEQMNPCAAGQHEEYMEEHEKHMQEHMEQMKEMKEMNPCAAEKPEGEQADETANPCGG